MSQSSIIERLAIDHVEDHIASTSKMAVSEETQDFIEWGLLKRDKVSDRDVINFLERQGVRREGAIKTKAGQPFKRGEHVWINSKMAPGHIQDILRAYHGNVAEIDEVDGEDVVLKLHGKVFTGQTGRAQTGKVHVPGGKWSGKASGLYRYSYGGSGRGPKKVFEVVYLSDKNAKPPSQTSIDAVKKYVERGTQKGEKRSRVYYSGYVSGIYTNKKGEDYFKLHTQQRPYPNNINPKKGDVLYIGVLNRRPAGWVSEHLRLTAPAVDEGEE